MQKGLVSVIIPNYNYQRFLRDAIDSALAQTYSEIEIIVVDDGSTDASLDVLAGYGDKIKTIAQQNQGVSAARNNGVLESSGEFIAFLDADDLWMPAKIEKQVERAGGDDAPGLIHVGVSEIDENGTVHCERLDGLEGRVADDLLLFERAVILGGGSGLMVRRSVFDEIGGFDASLTTSADWDMFYQVSSRYPIGFVPEALVAYRMHGSNMHGNIDLMKRDMMVAFNKAFSIASPRLMDIRRRAYGNLNQNLAGSYFVAGNYPAFVWHSIKSLALNPRNIGHFLRFPRRRIAGKGE